MRLGKGSEEFCYATFFMSSSSEATIREHLTPKFIYNKADEKARYGDKDSEEFINLSSFDVGMTELVV
ncbi:MAG: hypothetical protein Kow0090_18800 [Myxococcota bacterium]